MLVALLLTLAAPVSAADRDGDGLDDGFETTWGVTDPGKRDSDGDGIVDSAEDNDRDRLGNLGEQRAGTDPGKRDSDGDGQIDSREDADGDGRSNAAEQDRRPIPAGLRPSLDEAKYDVSPYKAGCQTTHGESTLTTCLFGKADSKTTIVLMGDSHAMMILSPIKKVAEDKGWKLVSLIKKACPPVLGIHNVAQKWIDDGVSCRQWRRYAIDWLDANPPDHIILAHSDNYQIADLKGVRISGRAVPEAWHKGMKRTLEALPEASEVLLLGDVPSNRGNPVHCLKKHPHDIAACATPLEPRYRRAVEKALREAAVAKGARFRSLYGKVCTYDPCPLIQGDILMWRDRGHLSTTFANQLMPTFRTLLSEMIGPASKRRR